MTRVSLLSPLSRAAMAAVALILSADVARAEGVIPAGAPPAAMASPESPALAEDGFFLASVLGGGSAGRLAQTPGATFGGALAYYREWSHLRVGLAALATGGSANWFGGTVSLAYLFRDAATTPFAGLGAGAFAFRRADAADFTSPRPTLSLEAGLEGRRQGRRWVASAQALLPDAATDRRPGQPREGRWQDVALLLQLGLAL